jgi:hypothetical protein
LPKNDNELLWLAVYNKSSLTEEKFKDLEGRKVILFPDLSNDSNTFNNWKDKAKSLGKLIKRTQISISTFLEDNAPDELKIKGGDLADYLSQFNWKDFQSYNESVKSVKKTAENKSFFKDVSTDSEESNEENLLDLLETQRCYSVEEIETIFMEGANINRVDANICFNYLLKDKVLMKTHINEYYYLASSTPF